MARRSHRVGLETTTISVRLTADELAQLDGERRRGEPPYYTSFIEARGDALRRLIIEAAKRRAAAAPLKPDPRQDDWVSKLQRRSYAPAGKTKPRRPTRPSKTGARA